MIDLYLSFQSFSVTCRCIIGRFIYAYREHSLTVIIISRFLGIFVRIPGKLMQLRQDWIDHYMEQISCIAKLIGPAL
jgi:hypothetical protein